MDAQESKDFEHRVADLFRALGASVVVDDPVGGAQVDVLVEEVTSAGVRIITNVECKYLARNPVGIDEVRTFAAVLDDQRRNNLVHRGVMVTNNGYSRPARDLAAQNEIQLLVVDDLESRQQLQLSVVSDAVRQVIDDCASLRRTVMAALAAAASPTAAEWEDVHVDAVKVVNHSDEVVGLYRQGRAGGTLERRVHHALVRLCEEQSRCLDTLWFIRQVASMSEERYQLGTPTAEQTTAAMVVLREMDAARGQLRQRLTRLEETCERLDRQPPV